MRSEALRVVRVLFAGTRATRPGEPVPHREARPWEAAVLSRSRASPTASVPRAWRRGVTFPAVPPSGTPSPHVGVSSDSSPLAVPLAGVVLVMRLWCQLLACSASQLMLPLLLVPCVSTGRVVQHLLFSGWGFAGSGCVALYVSLHGAPDTAVPSCTPCPPGQLLSPETPKAGLTGFLPCQACI